MVEILSKVATFIDLLSLEEFQHETRPYNTRLQLLTDHSEHGICSIFHRLNVIHYQSGRLDAATAVTLDLGQRAAQAAVTVTLTPLAKSASRHVRGYSILCKVVPLIQRLAARVQRHL